MNRLGTIGVGALVVCLACVPPCCGGWLRAWGAVSEHPDISAARISAPAEIAARAADFGVQTKLPAIHACHEGLGPARIAVRGDARTKCQALVVDPQRTLQSCQLDVSTDQRIDLETAS